MSMESFLAVTLPHALILSSLLSLIVVLSLRANAEMWLGDYPEDIQEAFGPMSEATRRQRSRVALIFFATIFASVIISVVQLFNRYPASPVAVFMHVSLMMAIFNTIDLLVLDWLFFVKYQPDYIILPGTRGLAGYRSYVFHFRGWLVGNIFSLAFGLVCAFIYYLVQLL
jgi:hypothetical protein